MNIANKRGIKIGDYSYDRDEKTFWTNYRGEIDRSYSAGMYDYSYSYTVVGYFNAENGKFKTGRMGDTTGDFKDQVKIFKHL